MICMRFKRKHIQRVGIAWLACLTLLVAGIFIAKSRVDMAASGRVYADVDAIPARKVALVLGCVRVLPNGHENLYFRYRIRAAHELYEAGKVEYLLVSGDNSRTGYDESSDMKDALVELGVPADRVVCDFAGFRTLDSVVRAKRVFCEDKLIVVSQGFHVRRAIYLGASHDVDLLGYAARDVGRRYGMRTAMRESLARLKAVLDVTILQRQPRYLGEPMPIGAAE